MQMKTIVVPFDFSPNARVALSAALQLAKATASGLLIVHILHESPYKLAAAGNEAEMNRLIRQDEMEKTIVLQQEADEMRHLRDVGGDHTSRLARCVPRLGRVPHRDAGPAAVPADSPLGAEHGGVEQPDPPRPLRGGLEKGPR